MSDQSSKEISHEYIIIGAGPAGLQAAYDLGKSGRDYVVLERAQVPGSFFQRYPRHRTLISINKRFTGFDDPELNLRWDWNSLLSDHDDELLFKKHSPDYFPHADRYVDYVADFARRAELRIEYGCEVTRVNKDAEGFLVTCGDGRVYRGARLIVATGAFKPYLPEIPGIELAEPYSDVSVDLADFENQRVLIIGKANSAFETGNHLLSAASIIHLCSPHPVQLAYKTKFVGHLRSINDAFIDSYQLKSQNVMLDAEILKLERQNDGSIMATVVYGHANGEVEELVYDRVIAATGFRFDTEPFSEECMPELVYNDRFPKMTSAWESTNVKGLYFAGVLMQSRDFKKKQSGFIHGFRYNVRAMVNILNERYHGKPLPSTTLPATAAALTKKIIERVNRSSAMFQQTGFLCDAIVIDGARAHYYEDLATDYVHDSDLGKKDHYYVVTLEFGLEIIAAARDALALERIHKDDIGRAAESSGVHPIVRRFSRGRLLNTHHVIEDIDSVWAEDVHEEPLLQYLKAGLERSRRRETSQPAMSAE